MKRLTKEQFRALPVGKKIAYVVWHHTADVFLGGMLLLMVGTLIWEEAFQVQPVMHVEMINASQRIDNSDAFDGFLDEHGYRKQKVEVSKLLQFGKDEEYTQCSPQVAMVCMVGEGKNDLYFWDSPEMEESLKSMALTDLRTVLSPELLEKYQDQLVYNGSMIHGGYPCAIYLEDNDWIQEHEYYDSCMVGVARDTENLEAVSAFLRYIL